ncbi:hypothetical protein [Ilumatobacter sp.]|uniref:hypothetical protein n=1 Tax=Ilumatobacter sp. TaxID=1967498 RepID=UPI003751BADD
MSLIVGVDPGKTGAIALLDHLGELISVYDMPIIGKHVSVAQLSETFSSLTLPLTVARCATVGEAICVIEDVSSSPQMGVTSAFSFGRSKGVVEAMAAAQGMRLVYVSPAKWKRDMRLNKDKGKAREMATRRWPQHARSFMLVKHDGRAEAALIGLWHINHGEGSNQ